MGPGSGESGGDTPPDSSTGSAGGGGSAADRPPASAEVTALVDAIRVVAERDLSGVPDLARLAEIGELWPAMCSLSGLLADRVGDVHGSGAAAPTGSCPPCRGCAAGCMWTTRGRPPWSGSAPAWLAASRAALAAGEISLEHAAALVDAATDLGVVFSVELEKILLDYAREHTPAEVRRLVRRIKLHMMDDDTAAERQIRLFEGRWLTASTTFEGMVHLEAMLDPVTGARVLAALEAYMPGPDPDPLTGRTARQRKADALGDMVAVAMANAKRRSWRSGGRLSLASPSNPAGSVRGFAPARGAAGQDLVLKVGWRHAEAMHEPDALALWNGAGAVVLHAPTCSTRPARCRSSGACPEHH